MAGPGHRQPPDPGGSQKVVGASTTSLNTNTNPKPTLMGSPSQAGARSFASVINTPTLSRFPTIKLAARQYGIKDGKPVISFTSAELRTGEENLRHTLVAKFSLGRPHMEDIRKAFLSAWNLNNKCSIGAWHARHILIILDNEGEARKVLAHPLRKIGHIMFHVFRWSKDFNVKKEPSTKPAWIRLPNLPLELYNPGYIDPIVTSFGRFLAVDTRTTSFNNPSFARVCVEIDTTNNLPDDVWIATGKDSGFWQRIEYEDTLLYCSKCKLHGHNLPNYRKIKRKNEDEQRIGESRDDLGLPIGALNITAPAMNGVSARTDLDITPSARQTKPESVK
ncbi:hypothetical protein QQ045_020580 [Rhodiola kirilowii]